MQMLRHLRGETSELYGGGGHEGRGTDRSRPFCTSGSKPHPALRRHLPRRCKHRSAAPPQAAASARSVATPFLAQPRCRVALGGGTSSGAAAPPSPSAEGEGSFRAAGDGTVKTVPHGRGGIIFPGFLQGFRLTIPQSASPCHLPLHKEAILRGGAGRMSAFTPTEQCKICDDARGRLFLRGGAAADQRKVWRMASATRMPSSAAEVIPPAYPAPSPQG